jgi:hypothetical protein
MLKAIVTTLILASSTVAGADNPYTHHRDTHADRYQARRWDRRFDHRRVVLAQGMSMGSRGMPRFIPIDSRFQPDRLRFNLKRGRAYIETITLVYADGRRETLRVDRPINKDLPSVVIDIQRGGLRGLLVDTRQRGYARGGGGSRRATAIVDVVGIRR